MKNKLTLLALFAVMAIVIAGLHYRIPAILSAICIGLAIFSAASGVQMLVTRKADIPMGDSLDTTYERHSGATAVFWGLLFVMFSVPFGAFGILSAVYGDNPPRTILAGMFKSPLISGLMITTVGGGLVLYGLTRLIGGRAAFAETGIRPFERVLAGGWTCLVGTAVALAGCVRMLAPGALTAMRDSAIAWALSLVK